MEPQPFDCGNLEGVPRNDQTMLQWSRSLSTAEMAERRAETDERLASMEPQPFDCGNRHIVCYGIVGASFNGAAAFRLRKSGRDVVR